MENPRNNEIQCSFGLTAETEIQTKTFGNENCSYPLAPGLIKICSVAIVVSGFFVFHRANFRKTAFPYHFPILIIRNIQKLKGFCTCSIQILYKLRQKLLYVDKEKAFIM